MSPDQGPLFAKPGRTACVVQGETPQGEVVTFWWPEATELRREVLERVGIKKSPIVSLVTPRRDDPGRGTMVIVDARATTAMILERPMSHARVIEKKVVKDSNGFEHHVVFVPRGCTLTVEAAGPISVKSL